MPYATDDDVREFYAGEDAGDLAVETVMGVAADLVQKYAPAPSPLPSPDDYSPRAKRAELLVGRWLWRTEGYVSGKSLSGVGSRSFDVSGTVVSRIVSEAMGDYAGADKAYIGRFPTRR